MATKSTWKAATPQFWKSGVNNGSLYMSTCRCRWGSANAAIAPNYSVQAAAAVQSAVADFKG